MQFEIVPYTSVGPLLWSMLSTQVASLVGAASRVSSNRAGNLVEFRDDATLSCIYDKVTKGLVEVSFSERKGVAFFGELDLVASSNLKIIRALRERDASAMVGFGSVVFPKLGIALTGYLPNDEQIKAVSAFAEGRWNGVLAKMQPLGPTA